MTGTVVVMSGVYVRAVLSENRLASASQLGQLGYIGKARNLSGFPVGWCCHKQSIRRDRGSYARVCQVLM